MKKSSHTQVLFTLLAVLLLSTLRAFGQGSAGTIEGSVTDSAGASIVGATVSVTADQTGITRQLVTNSSGLYAASELPAGTYSITVTAQTFTKLKVTQIALAVGSVHTVDLKMTAGVAQDTVTVTGTNNIVDNASSTVQGVVNGQEIRELPLNGRDFTNLAVLQPGVSAVETQFASSSTTTARLSRGFGSQLTIGGNRPQQTNYRFDGVTINDYANGSPGSVSGLLLGVDAVQEFSVITSNAPAQYGHMSGGVVNSISRSGTNQFHGSIYDYVRNSVFDARNYFDPTTIPSFRRNQFGGSVGGPVIREKTFFFANYEGFRQSLGSSLVAVVPTAAARQGKLVAGAVTVDPKVVPYLAIYALPNGAINGDTGNYSFVTQAPTNEDFITAHMDHTLSDKDTLHATGQYDTSSSSSADGLNTVIDEAVSRRTIGSIEEIHVFSPQLTNAARIGYSRSVAVAPLQKGVVNPAAADPTLGFFPTFNVGSIAVTGLTRLFGGVGTVGTFGYHYNSYQAADDVSLLRGKHSIAIGASVEAIQDNSRGGILPGGEWSFGSLKSFLTNVPTFFDSGLPATPVGPLDLKTFVIAGYVQDDWHVSKNLSLNLGMRYEMATDITAAGNRLGTLQTPQSVAPTSVHSFFQSNPTLKNFEPRLGFSWDPFSQSKTAIRGAIGLYDVLPLPYIFNQQALGSYPVYEEGQNTATPKGSFPTQGFLNYTPLLRALYADPKPKRSYEMQYTLNAQQQLTTNTVMTIGYIGSHSVHEPLNTNDINIVLPVAKSPLGYVFPAASTNPPRLNPNLGTISGTYFVGSGIYNSLQSTLHYTKASRFQGQLSYTWSRSSDDSSSAISGSSFDNSIPSPAIFDVSLNRALSDYDVRHVFTAYSVTTLPSPGASFGRWGEILRKWSVNEIATVRSGLPFSPVVGGDPLGTQSASPISDFPDRVRKTGCTRGHQISYLDTSCFAFPAPYAYAQGLSGPRMGNGGRNSTDGPGLFELDFGLQKEIPISEHLRAQFQAQAFNATNHTNFDGPQATQRQIFNQTGALLSTAGQLTETLTTSRQIQFALKILY